MARRRSASLGPICESSSASDDDGGEGSRSRAGGAEGRDRPWRLFPCRDSEATECALRSAHRTAARSPSRVPRTGSSSRAPPRTSPSSQRGGTAAVPDAARPAGGRPLRRGLAGERAGPRRGARPEHPVSAPEALDPRATARRRASIMPPRPEPDPRWLRRRRLDGTRRDVGAGGDRNSYRRRIPEPPGGRASRRDRQALDGGAFRSGRPAEAAPIGG